MQHTSSNISFIKGFWIRIAAGLMVLGLICAFSLTASAQSFPLEAHSIRGLDFGSFSPYSSGGSVTVSPDGVRTSSGNIILIGAGGSSARFEVKARNKRLITMTWQATTTLTNGSHSLTLTIGPTDRNNTYVTNADFESVTGNPWLNYVQFGGTLTVGSIIQNPAGNYSGTFDVTFHQN